MANETTEEFQELIATKAAELFGLCDKEKKGFIIKRDIQHLRDELDVEPEQLEDVFDTLDIDHNGYLTLEEFTSGFGNFLTNQMSSHQDPLSESIEQETTEDDRQDEFHQTLEALGAKDVFNDEEMIMGLWTKLRETDPILLRQFEDFLRKTTEEIKRSKLEHQNFETVLRTKTSLYDDEIKRMYDEMEQQLKSEKAMVLEQERLKEREIREQMETELHRKEQELAETMRKQTELEMRFLQSNQNENEIRNENERLQKEKTMLEEQLHEMIRDLDESKQYINQLQWQTKQEKRDRAKQALNLTENLAQEREQLVKELNLLKSINQQLLDERDLQRDSPSQDDETSSSSRRYIQTQGSILSNYFSSTTHRDDSEPEEDDAISTSLNDEYDNDTESMRNSTRQLKTHGLSARQQPIGASPSSQHLELLNVPLNAVPDRLFKVALIGDSGVGKTSFVQRLCHDTFKESFSATIGVDLQVKMLNVNHRIVALQLWDTAGQERFRSITTQYFRKADGIVLMYDVTSEVTFRNVRAWMSSIQEHVESSCVIILIGNKIDLCEDDERRSVQYKDGAQLADEYGYLFFETSTRSGIGILEPMEAMARLMQDRDDRLRQGDHVIDISSKQKRRPCCQ